MDEKDTIQLDQLLKSVPGGIAKLAIDDVLTILYATDMFYSLFKNATEKVITKEPLALLRIVYSADIINLTQQLAVQKNRKDNLINLSFRSLQQDGSFKWVMITGSRSEEIYQSEDKTVPVYSCIAMDLTDYMLKLRKIEQTNEYHRTISELSKELYFEYEIATDTLTFTELFREVFGKDAIIPNFRKKLEKTKIVHQEELPGVIAIFNSMMSGRKQVRFEVQLIPKNGNPCSYICYASIIFDENRNPYKVVGKLSIVNPLKKEPEAVLPKANLDSLTHVYTKDSAENLIEDIITKQEEDSLSALFLVDIRNYKSINEIRRTINGENILTAIGELLKTNLRSSDIVGRVGLGEFVIYLRDIRSDHNALDKAEKICKAVEALYSYDHTKNSLSVSIGIAFQKGISTNYHNLLTNANAALVMAKKVPTSSFEVFYGVASE